MKKPVLLAPRNATREVSQDDAARLLRSGSWCRVAGTAPVSKQAAWYRRYRERRQLLGFRQLTVWISPETYMALQAVKLPKEKNSDFFDRLVKLAAEISCETR